VIRVGVVLEEVRRRGIDGDVMGEGEGGWRASPAFGGCQGAHHHSILNRPPGACFSFRGCFCFCPFVVSRHPLASSFGNALCTAAGDAMCVLS